MLKTCFKKLRLFDRFFWIGAMTTLSAQSWWKLSLTFWQKILRSKSFAERWSFLSFSSDVFKKTRNIRMTMWCHLTGTLQDMSIKLASFTQRKQNNSSLIWSKIQVYHKTLSIRSCFNWFSVSVSQERICKPKLVKLNIADIKAIITHTTEPLTHKLSECTYRLNHIMHVI